MNSGYGKERFNTDTGNTLECVWGRVPVLAAIIWMKMVYDGRGQSGCWRGCSEPKINVAVATEEELEASKLFSSKYPKVCQSLKKYLTGNLKIFILILVPDATTCLVYPLSKGMLS